MTVLQVETKLTHYVNAFKLEEFIARAWGITQARVNILETPNDTDYAVTVEKKPLDQFQEDALQEAKNYNGFEYWHLETIMQSLANQDLIPPGDYVVQVSW